MDGGRGTQSARNNLSTLESARERALDTITEAFAKGDLSLEEYEVKASALQKARLVQEIEDEVFGIALPSPLPLEAEPVRSRAPSRQNRPARPPSVQLESIPVEDKHGTPEFSLCIMGDKRMRGEWLNSDQATSLTLMGSTTLDLRGTTLPPGRLKIDAMAIMGEIQIIVPEGLPVKMSAFPFMGEAVVKDSVEQRIVPGMPWVDVSGIALMGSIVVKVR